MSTPNAEYLRENGPSPSYELPDRRVGAEDKMAGVWVFNPRWRTHEGGTTKPSNSPPSAIYYIDGEHEPASVLKAWLDENKRDGMAPQSLHTVFVRGRPEEWKQASREVLREEYGSLMG